MTKKEMQYKIFYLQQAIDDYEALINHFYELKKGMNKEKADHAEWIKDRAEDYKEKAKGIK